MLGEHDTVREVPDMLARPQDAVEGAMDRHQVVLVIDDDTEIRHVIHEVLADEGYQVQEASDGAQGLEILASAHRPLVVLLDLMMPRMDGFEVCRRLEADPALRDQHAIILMSARKRLEEANSPVVDAMIAKPFDVNALLATVDHLAEHLNQASGGEAL
jgi:CheY-like chemotaxis protein